jgi:pimeloyl-ACP methyl ester carboxylesterase
VVGHSYGGAVITGAAVGDPEVKALVYRRPAALADHHEDGQEDVPQATRSS